MKLTKEECEKALYGMVTKDYNELITSSAILLQLIWQHFDNPPLEFISLEEGKWYWDNHCKEYFKIDHIHEKLQSITLVYGEGDDEVSETKYYEKDRFYHREVQDETT